MAQCLCMVGAKYANENGSLIAGRASPLAVEKIFFHAVGTRTNWWAGRRAGGVIRDAGCVKVGGSKAIRYRPAKLMRKKMKIPSKINFALPIMAILRLRCAAQHIDPCAWRAHTGRLAPPLLSRVPRSNARIACTVWWVTLWRTSTCLCAAVMRRALTRPAKTLSRGEISLKWDNFL